MQLQKLMFLFLLCSAQLVIASGGMYIMMKGGHGNSVTVMNGTTLKDSNYGKIVVEPGATIDDATIERCRKRIPERALYSMDPDVITVEGLQFSPDGTLLTEVGIDKLTLIRTVVSKVVFQSGKGIVYIGDGAAVREVIGGVEKGLIE